MVFYTAIAAVYGAICYTFVRFFAFLLLWVTHRFLQLGVWGDNRKLMAIWPDEPRFMDLVGSSGLTAGIWSESIAAFLIHLFLWAVVALVVCFIISFYFSANTIIYSLIRNRVDNTALEDIYTYFDEAEIKPATTEPQTEQAQPDSSPSQE